MTIKLWSVAYQIVQDINLRKVYDKVFALKIIILDHWNEAN